jgi:hypothetical protein
VKLGEDKETVRHIVKPTKILSGTDSDESSNFTEELRSLAGNSDEENSGNEDDEDGKGDASERTKLTDPSSVRSSSSTLNDSDDKSSVLVDSDEENNDTVYDPGEPVAVPVEDNDMEQPSSSPSNNTEDKSSFVVDSDEETNGNVNGLEDVVVGLADDNENVQHDEALTPSNETPSSLPLSDSDDSILFVVDSDGESNGNGNELIGDEANRGLLVVGSGLHV